MKKIYIAMAVIATAALASCQQEKSFNDLPPVGENSVVFTVKGSAGTRSADVVPETRQGVLIPLETEDGSRFVLEETVTSLDALLSETRGTPAYTENLGALYANNLSVYAAEGTFGTATYENMESSLYPRKDASQGDGWRYQHNYNGDPWPESGAVGFYLNMPAAPTGVSITGRTGGKFTFTYTSPTTAAEQQDILFAYRSMTKEQHHGFLPNGAPVLFQHALTAVKFAIGNDDDDISSNKIAITEVIFNGLVNSGTCEISPSAETNYTDNKTTYSSAGGTSWPTKTAAPNNTISSGTYSGTQTYTSGSNNKFGDSWYSAGNEKNLNDADGTQTFWLIPQTVSSGVTLTIKYTFAGTPGEWTIDFGKVLAAAAKPVNWQAGELRTYTIKVDDVNLKIEDTVTNTVKSDVAITNTGNTTAFIRAAIVGQWLDHKNRPVFGFTDLLYNYYAVDSWYQDQFVNTTAGTHGTFTGLAGYKGTNNPLNKWYLCDDGFYYYSDPVDPGKIIGTAPSGATNASDYLGNPLFTKYEIGTAPSVTISGVNTNIHFSLEIATQAVTAKKLDGSTYTWQEAWENATGTAPVVKQ